MALGAFGAHVLRDRLAVDMLANFETGVRYQMYHALALLAVAWAVSRWPDSGLPVAAGWRGQRIFDRSALCQAAACPCQLK